MIFKLKIDDTMLLNNFGILNQISTSEQSAQLVRTNPRRFEIDSDKIK